MVAPDNASDQQSRLVASLDWYHTIDLGNGLVTPGHYDHRQYLKHYALPDKLAGKTVLDIGTASGFFAFEFERRGAQVTATDLPQWFDHDFGPQYQPDQTLETGQRYLHEPFDVAKQIIGSNVDKKLINIYDLSPETIGIFDIVFCGSLLVHLTDPTKALWNIASVTREKAIISTVITPENAEHPLAAFIGYHRGDVWWLPSRACLELMAVSAGFVGIEWVSEFRLDFRDGSAGPYHGVLHAYKTTDNWTPHTVHRDAIIERQLHTAYQSEIQSLRHAMEAREQEVRQLQALVHGYEQGRFIRFMRWVDHYRRGASRIAKNSRHLE